MSDSVPTYQHSSGRVCTFDPLYRAWLYTLDNGERRLVCTLKHLQLATSEASSPAPEPAGSVAGGDGQMLLLEAASGSVLTNPQAALIAATAVTLSDWKERATCMFEWLEAMDAAD